MAKEVIIDQDECLGCEACVELCPEIFGFDGDDAKAFVIEVDSTDVACIEEAIASCPSDCISYK